ncbi:MAG: hypothetical protein SFY95_00340 [Planctomycetota bacterium]|nr:hypothetical protein [Planctomycetota bacterium]
MKTNGWDAPGGARQSAGARAWAAGALLGAALAGGTVAHAAGPINLIADTRVIRAEAGAVTTAGTAASGPFEKAPLFGAAFSDNVQAGIARIGASASASVSQTSSIASGEILAQGSFSSSALVTSGISARARVANLVDLRFYLPTGASWEAQGSTAGNAFFQIYDASGALVLSNLGFASGTVASGGVFRLIAGDNAGGQGGASRPDGPSGFGGSYSVRFTSIPTPGGCVALGLAGVCTLARRRRTGQ